MSYENIGRAADLLELATDSLTRALSAYEAGAAELKEAPLEVLARAFVALDKAHDRVEDARKSFNKELMHLQNAVLPRRFELAQVPDITITLKDGRNFKVIPGSRLSATMKDKEAAIQWMKDFDENSRALVQETVPANTLSSFARDLIKERGMELPEDLFEVKTSPYVSVRAKA